MVMGPSGNTRITSIVIVSMCLGTACLWERDNPRDEKGTNPGLLDLRLSDTAKPDVHQVDLASSADMKASVPGKWITVTPALFKMGAGTNEPCMQSDEAQHYVTLKNKYSLQATEVTQAQFLAVMNYKPASITSCGSNCPVENVSWHEAAAYCNALSVRSGQKECYLCIGKDALVSCEEAYGFKGKDIYTCPGYRLPTEAEWEHAYRAGTTTAYYSGTNEPSQCTDCATKAFNADKIGWYCANSGKIPHAVGGKGSNAWGLFDMAGNVAEWCHDWYQMDLGIKPMVDPVGTKGTGRVFRGGSWQYYVRNLRAAHRDSMPPQGRAAYVGFRCGRTVK